MNVFKFGWWTTGRDQAAVNLFNTVWDAVNSGKINGKIGYVFVSRHKGEGKYSDEIIALCQQRGIKCETFSAKAFLPELRKNSREAWRRAYHDEVFRKIERYNAPLVVLAGYMWVLSAEICSKISAINLHPALPGGPIGTWQEVIWTLLEKDLDKTGAMMHLVTAELDRGPAISYFEFPIKGEGWDYLWEEFYSLKEKHGFKYVQKEVGEELELFKKIRHEGEIRELPLIVQTLRAFSLGQLKVGMGKILDHNGKEVLNPINLTEEVNKEIANL